LRKLTDKKIKNFADYPNKIGKQTLENGVKTAVHPHLTVLSGIENRSTSLWNIRIPNISGYVLIEANIISPVSTPPMW